MKSKQIRTIIISVLVLLIVAAAILRIDIEPAGPAVVSTPSPNLPSISTAEPSGIADTDDKAPAVDTSVTETPEPSMRPVETIAPTTPPVETAPLETPVQMPTTGPATPEPTPEATHPQKPEQPVETPDIPAVTPTPESTPVTPERHVCTIEIRCDTVVDTSKLENQAVAPFVPASGVILGTTEVEFSPGESVFDILLRATRDRNIHMEFRDDNLYSGKYIEGINYLYEMDGGPLSGWMYKVNGLFPNYGCAAYKVNDGDRIVWVYTCDLGVDVGDNSSW